MVISAFFFLLAAGAFICAEKLVKNSLGQKGKIGNSWKLLYNAGGKNFQNW